MFANAFQSGFISIFYSVGSAPLSIWNKEVKNGHIRRIVDEEVKSLVLEISGTNVATTYITCPQKPRVSLAIKLPFLVMIIKNMKKYFTFEIQILDDKDIRRRFRVSNFQSTTKVRPFCTTMPIGLSDGWNQVQFNLADFTRRAYGSTYMETVRVQIHANVRIRRIYFSDTLYSEEEMPNEFRLFLPTSATKPKPKEKLKFEKKKAATVTEEPSAAPPSPVDSERAADEEGPPPSEAAEGGLTAEEQEGDRPSDEGAQEGVLKPEEGPSAAEEPRAEQAGEGSAPPPEGEVAAEDEAPLEHAETPSAPPPEGEEAPALPAEEEPIKEENPDAPPEQVEAPAEELPAEAPPPEEEKPAE